MAYENYLYSVSKLLMINQQKKILLLVAISLVGAKISGLGGIAKDSMSFLSPSINSSSNNASLYAQAPKPCQKLGQNHDEVYGFLTHNFHIGICSYDDQFYYYRQSKSNPKKNIVLKATRVLGGKVFKAEKGRVTYFVGTNAKGYYSSVMQPNHEIVVELEVKPEKFHVNTGNSINLSPALTEQRQLADFGCNTEESYESSEIEPDFLSLKSSNSQSEQKDAILYSYSCL